MSPIESLLEQARKFLDENPKVSVVELTDSLGYKVRVIQDTKPVCSICSPFQTELRKGTGYSPLQY